MPLNLSLHENTYSVSAVCREVRELLQEAYPSIWVAGEVNRVRDHRSGHFYFELIEKGEGDQIVGKLEAVAWRNDFREIRRLLAEGGQEISEGQEIRCRGNLDFYPPFGRLQFVVREVDPVFTLGLMARRRQETLAALAAAGLLERNRERHLPSVPLTIGLVTSHGSAAYHDFLSSLRESGYGFRVLFVHASVQGKEAEREVVSALRWLSGADVDCLALIRGGGSRSDLAVFDSRAIAEAVALASVPVLTGLGHEIDQSIADLTAHSAFKTPTMVAEFLVERVSEADRHLREVRGSLARSTLEMLRQGRQALGRAERGLALVRYRLSGARSELHHVAKALPVAARHALQRASRGLGETSRRLAVASRARFDRDRQRPRLLLHRIASRAEAELRELSALLTGLQRLCVHLAPERTLRRGFSITRDGAGRALSDPGQVAAGDLIISELRGGSLTSRVEES